MFLRILLVCSVLTACTPANGPQVPTNPRITLIPDATGLAVAPSGKRIDFGRSPKGVIPILDRALGHHIVLSLATCPAGIWQNLRWGDLTLTFTKEQFVGWQQDDLGQGSVCAS